MPDLPDLIPQPLPCPHCGSNNLAVNVYQPHNPQDYQWGEVKCQGCFATASSNGLGRHILDGTQFDMETLKRAAVYSWNARFPGADNADT